MIKTKSGVTRLHVGAAISHYTTCTITHAARHASRAQLSPLHSFDLTKRTDLQLDHHVVPHPDGPHKSVQRPPSPSCTTLNAFAEFLDAIRSVNPPGRWKILVVDEHSQKLVDMVLKQFDILEENVTRTL